MYFSIFRDGNGKFAWALYTADHEQIAIAAAAYDTREECVAAINAVRSCAIAMLLDKPVSE